MTLKQYFNLLLLLISFITLKSQSQSFTSDIPWERNTISNGDNVNPVKRITFPEVEYQENNVPIFRYIYPTSKNSEIKDIKFKIVSSTALTTPEKQCLPLNFNIKEPIISESISGNQRIFIIDFQAVTNTVKINRIEFEIELKENSKKKSLASNYPKNSPLSEGNWYKIGTTKKGVFKITGKNLVDHGININGFTPSRIKVFGQNNGMLPELNSIDRPLGLIENAIEVVDGGDNSFDETDYLLFYSSGADNTFYDDQIKAIRYKTNIYSDSAFYFLNFDLPFDGKRIQNISNLPTAGTQNVTSYDEFWYHELQKKNLDRTGREWFGEKFDITKSYQFNISSPNRVVSDSLYIEYRGIANNSATSKIEFKANGSTLLSQSISGISPSVQHPPIAVGNGYKNTKTLLPNPNITFSIDFDNNGVQSAFGYIDYILLNYRNSLTFNTTQTHFRDYKSYQNGGLATFNFTSTSSSLSIWNITDQTNIKNQEKTGNSFTANVETLNEYIAFSSNNSFDIESISTVKNQNLHSIEQADYILIYHPKFKESALELKKFHETYSGYTVAFASTSEIYNEFASGKQDLTALKDFIGMIYHRNFAMNTQPQAVLLFGDASYDYKNYSDNNSNYVPTWEDVNSFSITQSNATDDYIVCLDESEGNVLNSSEAIDIPIGRFVVQTEQQGFDMVNKIKAYKNLNNRGSWQSRISLVTDDVDANWERNLLTNQANILIDKFSKQNIKFNINKIYSDAFQQINSSGGQRYPQVEKAIDDAVLEGSLIVHYYGHGGESGWATERILNTGTINAWDNIKNLAAFVTTTCEFTRYDDLTRVSAGELTHLNANGGAIALFTSTRELTTQDANRISDHFYRQLNGKNPDGTHYTMGQIFMKIKQNYLNYNSRRFILIGDPGLKLNYPEKNIVLTKFNNQDILTANIDTIKALSKIKIEGEVVDLDGSLLNDFSGIANIQVFDKPKLKTTLNNDNAEKSPGVPTLPIDFSTQTNKVFKGEVGVTNGKFTAEFIVPKDIDFNYGNAKISLYAKSDQLDAWGVDTSLIVGGIINNPDSDNQGPDIRLFMNDSSFISGGITSNNPDIYAILYDINGINAVGTGVGHDISAVLDAENSNPIILNDYYQTFPNSYTRGEVLYPLNSLEDGEHTLNLKAWDNYNNSNSSEITFIVTSDQKLIINDVGNIPNPFRNFTDFQFEHNYEHKDLEVTIEIYNLSGVLMKTLNQTIDNAQTRIKNTLTWTGTTDYGESLNSGLYIYRLIVKAKSNGQVAKKSEKLVIIK